MLPMLTAGWDCRNMGTILMFAVLGTILSTLVFSLLTWLLVLVRVVKHQHLGSSPLLSCMLYGVLAWELQLCSALLLFNAGLWHHEKPDVQAP